MTSASSANSTISQYIAFVQYTRAVNPSDIAKILNDKLRHEMDLHPDKKDPDVLHALRETVKYHPNTENVVREFLGKYLSPDDVEREIGKSKKELEEEVPGAGIESTSIEVDGIRQKIEEFERLYYERSPQSLAKANDIGTELFKSGVLSIHERKRVRDQLTKIEDAIQKKDFSAELPVEVKTMFNKHRTPVQSGMYHLALRYVEDAYRLLKQYANEQPGKWSHMVPWPDAERLIADISEKVEILNYKDKADEYIAKGNWQEAQNYYRMYLSEFINDMPVNEKSERLSQLLMVLENIKNVTQGNNIELYTIEKLSAWFRVLQNAAPVLGSSPAYIELVNSYATSVRSVVIREINQIQNGLGNLETLNTMGEIRKGLLDIHEILSAIQPLITGNENETYRNILNDYDRKKTIFEGYEKIVNQINSGDDEHLFNAMRSLSTIASEFGEKGDIAQVRRNLAKALIIRANQKVTFWGALFNFRLTNRANLYLERAREIVSEDELKDSDAYEKLVSRLRWGRILLILSVLVICGCLSLTLLLGGIKAISLLVATPTLTVTPTLTPSLTPTITVTPSPTSTIIPSATQRPVAIVIVSSYINVLDKPNGKTQTAYVTYNQLVTISDCVTDEDNISWIEIVWGENDAFSGWIRLEQVGNIIGSLYCR